MKSKKKPAKRRKKKGSKKLPPAVQMKELGPKIVYAVGTFKQIFDRLEKSLADFTEAVEDLKKLDEEDLGG